MQVVKIPKEIQTIGGYPVKNKFSRSAPHSSTSSLKKAIVSEAEVDEQVMN